METLKNTGQYLGNHCHKDYSCGCHTMNHVEGFEGFDTFLMTIWLCHDHIETETTNKIELIGNKGWDKYQQLPHKHSKTINVF